MMLTSSFNALLVGHLPGLPSPRTDNRVHSHCFPEDEDSCLSRNRLAVGSQFPFSSPVSAKTYFLQSRKRTSLNLAPPPELPESWAGAGRWAGAREQAHELRSADNEAGWSCF